MSPEKEVPPPAPQGPLPEDLTRERPAAAESLTDWMDRMDRAAFRRSLELRDLRLVSAELATRR